MSFIEKLYNREIQIEEEILNIWAVFNESIYGVNISVKQAISKEFKNFPHRVRSIDLDKFLEENGIQIIVDYAKQIHWESVLLSKEKLRNQYLTIDKAIEFYECIWNLLWFLEEQRNFTTAQYFLSNNFTTNIHTIKENITQILEKFNYEIKYFEKLGGYYAIVEKDFAVTEAAEIVADKEFDLAEDIYLYKHRSMEGNLNEKNKIICILYKYFENNIKKLSQKVLIEYGYSKLCDDIGFISNKIARHGTKADKQVQAVMNGTSDEQLEKYYDILFELYLQAIMAMKYIELKNEIKDFRDKFKEENEKDT